MGKTINKMERQIIWFQEISTVVGRSRASIRGHSGYSHNLRTRLALREEGRKERFWVDLETNARNRSARAYVVLPCARYWSRK